MTEDAWFERVEANVPTVFIKTYERGTNGQTGAIFAGGFCVGLPGGPAMEYTRRLGTGFHYVGMGDHAAVLRDQTEDLPREVLLFDSVHSAVDWMNEAATGEAGSWRSSR